MPRKSVVSIYLATARGKNFLDTNPVSEIGVSYYWLMDLDNLL